MASITTTLRKTISSPTTPIPPVSPPIRFLPLAAAPISSARKTSIPAPGTAPLLARCSLQPFFPQSIFVTDPGLRTPYVQSWNLNIQREVTHALAFEIGYVGSKGTRLTRLYDANQGRDSNINNPGLPAIRRRRRIFRQREFHLPRPANHRALSAISRLLRFLHLHLFQVARRRFRRHQLQLRQRRLPAGFHQSGCGERTIHV